MKIVPIIKNSTSDYHRLSQPLKLLGVDVNINNLTEEVKDANIVIFNRWAGFEIEHLLRAKKRYGFKIVCDLDDYLFLNSNHILYNSWNNNEMPRKIQEAVFNSDYIFTSTNRLADVFKNLNNKIEVIPNGLLFDKEQFVENKKESDVFEIVYVGGSTHFWDLLSLKNLFYKLSRTNLKKQITVSIAGYNDSTLENKKLWDAMVSIISANKRIKTTIKKYLPVDEYMNLYDGASLAIAPLENNYFNRFKSNLKLLEAGCKKIPLLASNVPPYSDENFDAFLRASSINEWYTIIEDLVNNKEKTKENGINIGEYVRNTYNLEKINITRKQIFEHLCK